MHKEQIDFRLPEVGRVMKEWWQELTQERPGKATDRAGRAQLKRCRSGLEVVMCPAFHRLYHRLQSFGTVDGRRLAPAAAVLAHVKEPPDAPKKPNATPKKLSLAILMASPRPGGSQPRVSGLRFRRLLLVEDSDELLLALVRVVRLLENKAPVDTLARDIYWWGERVKKHWAYDYYATAPQAD